jgi:hypothetical protein
MADRVKKKPAPLSSNAIQLRISGSAFTLSVPSPEEGHLFFFFLENSIIKI